MPKGETDSFWEGVDKGNTLFDQIMAQHRQKAQDEQKAKNDAADRDLKERQFSQTGQHYDYQNQLLQEQIQAAHNTNDPVGYMNRLMGGFSNQGQQMNGMPNQKFDMSGMAIDPESDNKPKQTSGIPTQDAPSYGQQQQQKQPNNFDNLRKRAQSDPFFAAMLKKGTGIDLTQETPAEKRELDLQKQLEMEDKKEANKEKQLDFKESRAVEKDLPALEQAKEEVAQLIKIAKDNPGMFGHWANPKWAETTDIKDFGTWQNLIASAIVNLESKMSSRGNQLALKIAQSYKPSHMEQQPIAISKLESMMNVLDIQIKNSKARTGTLKGEKEAVNAPQNDDARADKLMRIYQGEMNG